jgi:hypothetical protein
VLESFVKANSFILEKHSDKFVKNADNSQLLKDLWLLEYKAILNSTSIEFKKDIHKWYFEKLLEKEMIANLNNQEFITLPNGDTVEVFEMSGKKLRSDKEENFTISDLYEMINKDRHI